MLDKLEQCLWILNWSFFKAQELTNQISAPMEVSLIFCPAMFGKLEQAMFMDTKFDFLKAQELTNQLSAHMVVYLIFWFSNAQ